MLPFKDNLPVGRFPVVTVLLIVANVVVHVLVADDGGLLPLLAAALFLWLFGASVEDSMSRWRYLVFCLAGGSAAIGVQLLVDGGPPVPAIAASGVVSAAVGGFVLLYPRARFVTVVFVPFFFSIAELPAWALAALWFVVQALVGAFALDGVAAGDAVGAFAHVGGLAFGLLAIRLFAQRRKQVPARHGPRAVAA